MQTCTSCMHFTGTCTDMQAEEEARKKREAEEAAAKKKAEEEEAARKKASAHNYASLYVCLVYAWPHLHLHVY